MAFNEEPSSAPTVTCSQGTVSGIQRETGAAFLGIPFAEPPVGELRFQAPVSVKSWDGVLEATAYGATAQKRGFPIAAIPEPSIPGDDILSLNVFTPAVGDTAAASAEKYGEKLPVLVWIHGGGFKAGSPASPWYDGAAFNRDGVVTLTIAYRLGFDGFGVIDGCPNNRGVRDMICALEWVRDNIADFGGDPERVTIAGQSAGGGSVLALLASPAARGLFHGVISESGAYRTFPLEASAQAARRVAEINGVPATYEGYCSLSEDAILDAQEQVEQELNVMPTNQAELVSTLFPKIVMQDLPFSPVADGEILPADTEAALRESADIPLLIGTTSHEFTFFGGVYSQTAQGVDVDAVLREGLGELAESYQAAWPELSGYDLLGQLVSEHVFRVPALRFALYRDESPAWLYNFSLPNADGLSLHCGELPFTFDCLHSAP